MISGTVFAKTTADCSVDSMEVQAEEKFNFLKDGAKLCAFGKSDLYYFRGCFSSLKLNIRQFKNDKNIFIINEKKGEDLKYNEKTPIKSLSNIVMRVDVSTCRVVLDSGLKDK